MKITWFGASSIMIESGDDRILIDPAKGPSHSENDPSWEDLMSAENILLTSGRIERSASIPLIINTSGATVYCSLETAALLEKCNTDPDLIAVVKSGLKLRFNSISASVLNGYASSAEYDSAIKMRLRSPHAMLYPANTLYLRTHLGRYSGAENILGYSITADNRIVLIPGSLKFNPDTDYPMYPDMLVLPYQGGSDDDKDVISAIDRIEPRSVMLDMFDDFYPPLTHKTDTRNLYRVLTEKYPDLRVIKPTCGKTVTLL